MFHIPFPHCASPLKGEFRRSPGPYARPSAAAESEERQFDVLIRGQRWIIFEPEDEKRNLTSFLVGCETSTLLNSGKKYKFS